MTWSTASPASTAPVQERLATAFAFLDAATGPEARAEVKAALSADDAFGAALDDDLVDALLAVLDRRGRLPDARELMGAFPHAEGPSEPGVFAERLLTVCARLGLAGERVRLRAGRIDPAALPGLLMPRRGNPAALLENGADGHLVAVPLEGGPPRPVPRGRLDALVFREIVAGDRDPAAGGSWLRGVLLRFRPEISGLLRLTLCMNALLIAVSLAVMTIYDSVLPTRSYDTLAWLVAGVAGAVGLELALRRRRALGVGRIAARVEYILATELFAMVASLPSGKLEGAPALDQLMRLKRYESLRDLIAGPLSAVALEAPSLLLFATALVWLGGPIVLAPLALIAIYAVLAAIHLPRLKRATRAAGGAQSRQSRRTLDAVVGLQRIRELGCGAEIARRLDEDALAAARAKRAAQEAQRRFSALAAAAPPLAGGGAALFGAWLVMQGVMTSGSLIAAMILIWRVIMPLQQAMLLLSRFGDVSRMVDQIDRLMAMPSEPARAPGALRRVVRGRLTCEGASFRHRDGPSPAVLGATFSIAPGELTAVTGPSGSGKTTLLRLMSGQLAAQSGSVALDGLNLRQWEPAALRASAAFASHFPTLFHGTVAQNLKLAAPGAPIATLERVADELEALDMIRALPDGMNTRLDEAAQAHLPRGLRQAIGLAQALLRDTKVLLLDEPAQAMSSRQEAAFLGALEARRGRVTIVMSTHRPSHVARADKVLTMLAGRVEAKAGAVGAVSASAGKMEAAR